jgi:hypothetical protein
VAGRQFRDSAPVDEAPFLALCDSRLASIRQFRRIRLARGRDLM